MFQQTSSHLILQMHQQRLMVCLDPAGVLPINLRPLKWENLSMQQPPTCRTQTPGQRGQAEMKRRCASAGNCANYLPFLLKGKLNKNKSVSNLVQVSSLVLSFLAFGFPG